MPPLFKGQPLGHPVTHVTNTVYIIILDLSSSFQYIHRFKHTSANLPRCNLYKYTLQEKFMILRKANNAERCQIRMLYRSVIGTPGCTWDDSYPDEENLSADLNAGTLFLLVDDGNIFGAVSVVPVRELDGLSWQVGGEDCCEISRIVIAPEHQGQGLAAAMLEMLFERLRKAGKSAVHLLVATENSPALKTYRKLGFTISDSPVSMFGHMYFQGELFLKK